MTSVFVQQCWDKITAWDAVDGSVFPESKAALRKSITDMFQGYEASKTGFRDLRKALAKDAPDETWRLLLEAEKAISDNYRRLFETKESELQLVREVLSEDLKTASDRVLALEIENQRLKRWREQVTLQLRTYADSWRGAAATVDHPMRLQSPSWPIECAGEVEAVLDDMEDLE